MTQVKMLTDEDFNFMQTLGDFKNFLIKYDQKEDGFKIGFMSKRTDPKPGEPVFYPIWITKIEIAPVMRQMFGSNVVDRLMQNPTQAFWLDCWLNGGAGEVLEKRQPGMAGRDFLVNLIDAVQAI